MKFLSALAFLLLLASSARAVDARTVREKANASTDELGGKLTIYFRDALTAKAIPDASVTFQNETGTTDADGKVSFAFPETPEDSDVTLTAEFAKKDYVPSKVPLLFRAGVTFDNHFSISPVLPPGNLRIVLDWGTDPKDLDAHLVKRGVYHISFRDARAASEQAKLDRDAQNGDGPETITIKTLDPEGQYAFFVHDYSDRGVKDTPNLSWSHAHVSVFGDAQLLRSFDVPSGRGPYWTVFFIRKGEIIPAGTIGAKPQDEPAAPAPDRDADRP